MSYFTNLIYKLSLSDRLNLLPIPIKTPAEFASKVLECVRYGSLFWASVINILSRALITLPLTWNPTFFIVHE